MLLLGARLKNDHLLSATVRLASQKESRRLKRYSIVDAGAHRLHLAVTWYVYMWPHFMGSIHCGPARFRASEHAIFQKTTQETA